MFCACGESKCNLAKNEPAWMEIYPGEKAALNRRSFATDVSGARAAAAVLKYDRKG